MIIKVVIIGQSGAGKTSILNRLVDDTFHQEFISTIGIDFKNYSLSNGNRLQMWDCGGGQRFRTITQAYYRGTQVFLVVFDISRKDSLQNSLQIARQARQANTTARFLFLGNKSDLGSNLDPADFEELKEEWNCCMQVSAKLGLPTEQLISQIRMLTDDERPAQIAQATSTPLKEKKTKKSVANKLNQILSWILETVDQILDYP